jgi:hypothetical protein
MSHTTTAQHATVRDMNAFGLSACSTKPQKQFVTILLPYPTNWCGGIALEVIG